MRAPDPLAATMPADSEAAEPEAAEPRLGTDPATNPIVAGTKRASVAPPPRPTPLPPVRRPLPPTAPPPFGSAPPRVSSALISPPAPAARATNAAVESPEPLHIAGTTIPSGSTDSTAVVKPLPRPATGAATDAATAAPEPAAPDAGRQRRGDLGKWLIGGAVAGGALVVALLAGAFDRPKLPESAAPAAIDPQAAPRKKARVTTDPELRSESDPPRTVGNSVSSAAAKQEPPPEAVKVAPEPPPEAAKVAAEPPPEAAKVAPEV
ncbi:MAG TPA: hypothetical protein VNO30_49445, partial [Kofleriaceae bacterium]|nr:hypothetical protein [Kofleriaceae bacterium]